MVFFTMFPTRGRFSTLLFIGIPVTIVAVIVAWISQNSSLSPKSITRKRCETNNSFTFISRGEFISGSDKAQRDYGYRISAEAAAKNPSLVAKEEKELRQVGWFDGESPRKAVSLPAFCISRNLVTNGEYLKFVRATNHRFPDISESDYQKQGFLVHPYSKVKSFRWINGKYPSGKAQHPVVLVSYEDALAFAKWKGKQDNQNYRLPTAQEWEKAARGEDGRYFPWGNQWEPKATNWGGSGLNYTSAISGAKHQRCNANFRKSRSPYGVEDMSGNVFEYTSTLQSQVVREVSVMKGCSWDDLPGFCRAAYYHTRPIKSRHILFGFRLVLE